MPQSKGAAAAASFTPYIPPLLILAGGYLLFKKLFSASSPNDAKVELTQKQVADEVKKKEAAGETPTYSESQYKSFADQLSAAMEGLGTNEQKIYDVFSKCKTLLDVLKIIDAFGIRLYHEFFTVEENYNLGQWLVNELSSSELTKLNGILAKNKINFSF